MRVTNFDKPTIKAIRLAMDSALAKVEKDYGIKISTGNARFSGNEVTFKVKANTVTSGGKAITKEAQMFDIVKHQEGLGHLSVGDTVTLQGKSFTITGYNTRARKSPINIEDMQGRGYKCSVSMLKMYNPA
tara:strand:+ start:2310 stop:2702 length:393 start_codon:yes stop_codon:yes gene_type:complete